MKKQKIKSVLDQASHYSKNNSWLSEAKKNELVNKLSDLENPDIDSIREIIQSDRFIKESIDFSDTNYLLSQLIKIIKDNDEKKNDE